MTDSTPTWPGGRTAGLARLQAYDPTHYGKTRNFLGAPVSYLSPYLRHGMLSLVEVREHLKARFSSQPHVIEELLRQLAWRDFFEKVLDWHGLELNNDLELPKHHVPRTTPLPADVAEAKTGLPCIDGMLTSLFETGYLHNHERLWFAAYLCHFRGVSWQVGAQLFRRYLLDGDIASNSCSWQWVESTFASKPYFMNKDNIATFSHRRWCDSCTAKCPFDATYETLQQRLFAGNRAPLASQNSSTSTKRFELPTISTSAHPTLTGSTIVWVHDAAMSGTDPAIAANPNALLVFVWSEAWAEHRNRFIREGWLDLLQSLPGQSAIELVGEPVVELRKLALQLGARTFHITDHPNPSVRRTIQTLQSEFEMTVHQRPVFAEYDEEPKRFSRYWEKVAPQVLGYRPHSSKKRMR